MSDRILERHIEITPGVAGGKPCIVGHRIKVRDVVIWHERMGKSPDEISAEYDLTLAEVYGALTYYFDHREEIDRDIHESDAFIQALRVETPSILSERLKAGRGE
ncbi:MAG: DUF433 domain-containing protein [Candidatus Omnitrophica bacterium]|nr:DUF433 domain-containing protein [Candidatus Omnitrophota bacterium]MCA9432274.1 DUF433 domain-containing protein [Candidatus Omnitrophota bacterium]MCA9444634.1 DUF433 domain-containing protein [Candidatus Omnitrophota bacterium]MCA9449987.1 DUF433 domain-containing protein [Candidatus Omnitrophota bacterium]MCB9767592.1 DUF433 domain-containing protein [Candidatus Omnitrophota bacterium]